MYVNNTKEKHSYVSIAKMVTRTRHNVTVLSALPTLNIIYMNPRRLAKLLYAYKVTMNRVTYMKRPAELYPPLQQVSTNSIFGQ